MLSLHGLSAWWSCQWGDVGGEADREEQKVSVSFVFLKVPTGIQGVWAQNVVLVSQILPVGVDVGACGRSVVPLCVCVSCAVWVQLLYDCTSHIQSV